jgi:dihydrodipicolinate synthase/N-acetylneuraminate lyase
VLSQGFWRRLVEIPNVIAIKIAPFNRYQTLDVVRAVAESGRANEVALYTGNDDSIVVDLLTELATATASGEVRLRIVGGLLGHWAFWTRRAVDLLAECKRLRARDLVPARMLTLGAQVTECNAAVFDATNSFRGCIPGIHEVLRRQGLLENSLCLDPGEVLSPNQEAEINRIHRAYPYLNDDAFVAEHGHAWLKG